MMPKLFGVLAVGASLGLLGYQVAGAIGPIDGAAGERYEAPVMAAAGANDAKAVRLEHSRLSREVGLFTRSIERKATAPAPTTVRRATVSRTSPARAAAQQETRSAFGTRATPLTAALNTKFYEKPRFAFTEHRESVRHGKVALKVRR